MLTPSICVLLRLSGTLSVFDLIPLLLGFQLSGARPFFRAVNGSGARMRGTDTVFAMSGPRRVYFQFSDHTLFQMLANSFSS